MPGRGPGPVPGPGLGDGAVYGPDSDPGHSQRGSPGLHSTHLKHWKKSTDL